jgi:ABC-2 type transport system ATP-binding protein
VLTEAAQTVDDVVVIHKGRLVHQGGVGTGASLEQVFFDATEEACRQVIPQGDGGPGAA